MFNIVGIEFHVKVSCLLTTVFHNLKIKNEKNSIHVEHVSINPHIASLNANQLIGHGYTLM